MLEGQYSGAIQLREAGYHSTVIRGIVYSLYSIDDYVLHAPTSIHDRLEGSLCA